MPKHQDGQPARRILQVIFPYDMQHHSPVMDIPIMGMTMPIRCPDVQLDRPFAKDSANTDPGMQKIRALMYIGFAGRIARAGAWASGLQAITGPLPAMDGQPVFYSL